MSTLRDFGQRGFAIDVQGCVYIETGLDNGNSFTNAVAFKNPPFKRLIGIEIHPTYADMCRKRFALDERVTIHEGDSASLLHKVIDATVKTVFWLDAHWCEASRGESGRESERFGPCVLMEELKAIRQAKWAVRPTILIDDAFYFCSYDKRRRHVKEGSSYFSYPWFSDIYEVLGGAEQGWSFAVLNGPEGDVIYCF
jgi:hypothetical protein